MSNQINPEDGLLYFKEHTITDTRQQVFPFDQTRLLVAFYYPGSGVNVYPERIPITEPAFPIGTQYTNKFFHYKDYGPLVWESWVVSQDGGGCTVYTIELRDKNAVLNRRERQTSPVADRGQDSFKDFLKRKWGITTA